MFWSEQEDITADGGFIVFLDIVYRRTGIRKYLDFASEAAERIAKDALNAPNGSRTWYDSWWRTIPTRVVSYPGLYVGAAGCGSSLLRAYAALTGKKLTNLYEYHFFEKI